VKTLSSIAVLLLASTLAFARHPKIAPDVDQSDPDRNVAVIVTFTQKPTEAHHQKVRKMGGVLVRSLDVIKAGHYDIPAGRLEELAQDPEVEFISPDRPVQGMLDLSGAAVNASAAENYELDGGGVGIAVLDSGVTLKDDLKKRWGGGRIVYSQDFTGQGVTADNYGHGTHVAGIAAGNGKDGADLEGSFRQFVGMAPNADIINLRVLDNNGQGSDSNVIAAIGQAIALESQYNIRVMNLSLGRPVFGSYTKDPLCQAVEAAWKAGIVVVVAAGNEGRNNNGGINGYGTITAPGNDPYVITVGAMKTMNTPDRSDDKIASYSSKGPTLYDHIVKPDIVAPGNQVRSLLASTSDTLFTQYPTTQLLVSYYATGYTNAISSNYFTLSGTSMATPVVSGAAALLIEQNPSITPDQVKARLMKTAYKTFPTSSIATDPSTGAIYTSYYDIFTVGAGYLDIQAALANNDTTNLAALSPAAVFNSSAKTVSLVGGTNVVWGSFGLLANNVVWCDNVVWGTNAMTGFNVVWGTGTAGTVDPANVVWGSSTNLEGLAVLTQGEN
jgi:serine protease AprX